MGKKILQVVSSCLLAELLQSCPTLQPYRLQPARLLCLLDFPGKNTGGLPFPSPGELPDPGIKPTFLMSPALVGGFFTTNATWKAPVIIYYFNILEYALIGVVFF